MGGARRETYNGEDVTLGGDLVVRIGDRAVSSSEDVSRIVSEELLPGQRVSFTIVREGTRRTVPVVLGERPVGSSG
jgi:S1-C subfamily serine protease